MCSRLLEGLIGRSVFNNLEEKSIAKNYPPVSLLSVVRKVFEKNKRNMAFFIIFSMVLGRLDLTAVSDRIAGD